MIAEVETQTVTLTLKVPADLAQRIHALPADTINRYALAALPGMVDAAEADAQPFHASVEELDLDLIAELRAGDDEAARVGTVSLEELIRQAEAETEAGLDPVECARARIAAYEASPERALFEADKVRHRAALEADFAQRGAVV